MRADTPSTNLLEAAPKMITNLAIEGLQGFGAFCGALFAVCIAQYFAGNSPVPFYLAMVFAFLGGMLFSPQAENSRMIPVMAEAISA